MRVRRPVGKRPGIQQPRPRPFQPGVIVDPAGPRPIGPRPVFDPRTINPGRPGTQVLPPRDPNMFRTLPAPGMPQPLPSPGMQQPRPDISTYSTPIEARGGIRPDMQIMQPGGAVDPIRQPGGIGPRPNIFGIMSGVGNPRLGAATIPGNQAQMQMRGPEQAAPVQPVPAMKKGGVVRGGRKETKGLRKAKLY